ncbi:conserved hypothetical protein [Nitrosococcus oceani ATCC 19707]|uniref:Uncharacterized protein n=2 Tax=Nitrosococcus oceani TaxID=1229 RepID=Q3JB08_NITOC|nr:hypothetical protein [Nitrosococcus oceani]ABA57988.1 conserved hypothetical protein [Nitrosococcus oceani ATCC 19707]EDZ67076.1 hypothetical protein NOC27_403 [Nitrosococcus oceani AFC27]KFI19577.1 hypothetical protein IB75_07885 [Nitrosococcus oceani C-27]GEM21758.1 hypothetical protein NONS58_32200 [Nitrosococcus oceani]
MKRKSFFMVIVGLGISLSAQAEPSFLTLSQVEGIVLVNQDKQFARAHNGMVLREGDRVVTMKESQVALRSEQHDCGTFLQENSLLTVPGNLNCEALTHTKTERYAALGDEVTVPPAPGTGNAAPQGGGSTAAATTPGTTGGATGGGISATASLIVGGVVVAAGGGLAAGLAATSEASPD